jgi:NADPH2:quinone reductase
MNERPDFQSRHLYFPQLRKPVIGMINGPLAGLGMAYALSCDVRFASDKAVFTTAYAKIGLSAEYGTGWMLRQVVGHANALDLLLSCRRVDAAEARDMGLYNKVWPADELVERTRAYARDMASSCAPRSLRAEAAGVGRFHADAARSHDVGQSRHDQSQRVARLQGGGEGLRRKAQARLPVHRGGGRMSLPGRMSALVVRKYGDWHDAAVETVAVPVPAPGEVLIRTEAASLNFADLLMIEGGYQVKPDLPFVAGRDAAGTVVAIGEGVRDIAVSDRVCAQASTGAFAEYDSAGDWACTRLPDGIDLRDAAACATAITTVVGAMKLRADFQPGQSVIVTGAAGGVGSMGLQYARLLGADPIAVVSSAAKADAAREMGAAAVVVTGDMADPQREIRAALKDQGFGQVDAVVDMVGGTIGEAALRCIRPGGRFVIVGFASGDQPKLTPGYLLVKDVMVFGSSLERLMRARDPALTDGMREAFAALADGRLRAQVDAVLPLSQFHEGAERMAGRQAIGKVVFGTRGRHLQAMERYSLTPGAL